MQSQDEVWSVEQWHEELPDVDPFADTTADMPEIRAALDAAGYTYSSATEAELVNCFLDYVAAGYWHNLCLEDAVISIEQGDIEVSDIIIALRGD